MEAQAYSEEELSLVVECLGVMQPIPRLVVAPVCLDQPNHRQAEIPDYSAAISLKNNRKPPMNCLGATTRKKSNLRLKEASSDLNLRLEGLSSEKDLSKRKRNQK